MYNLPMKTKVLKCTAIYTEGHEGGFTVTVPQEVISGLKQLINTK